MHKSFSMYDYVEESLQTTDLITLEKEAIANNDLPMLIIINLKRFKKLFAAKKYSESLLVLQDCELMLEQLSNEELWLQFLRCKSMTVDLNFQLQQTIDKMPPIIQLAKQTESHELQSLAFYVLGHCYASLGDVHKGSLFMKMAWYYIQEVEDGDEQQSVIISYYCLYLLEQGDFVKVKQLLQNHDLLQKTLTYKVLYGTIAMREGELDTAFSHYDTFLTALEVDDLYIYFDFQLMLIENEVSTYLIKHQDEQWHVLYAKLVSIRQRFTEHQFKAKQQDISTYRNNIMRLDNFILQGQAFIQHSSEVFNYYGNMVITVDEVDDLMLTTFITSQLQTYLKQTIEVQQLPFYVAKTEFNTVYILFLAKNVNEAQQLQTTLEQQITRQSHNYEGDIRYAKLITKRQKESDFYEMYTNTVAKLFI